MSPPEKPLADVRNPLRAAAYAPLARDNLHVIEGEQGCIRMGQIDIHLNTVCNLRCVFCPTDFSNGKHLPVEAVPLLAKLDPRTIVLSGGGEPVLWNDHGRRLPQFVSALREHMDDVPLGLITNGTIAIDDKTAEEFAWIRVSLNAATPESYLRIHQRQKFDDVLATTARYLKSNVQRVGLGFVYTPETVREVPAFGQLISQRILPNISPEEAQKLSLQFRPEADDAYQRFALSPEHSTDIQRQMESLPPEALDLLLLQSNIRELLNGTCISAGESFSRCHHALLKMVIDAAGNAYPCPQKASAREDAHGNIFDADFFSQLPRRLGQSHHEHSDKTCSTCSHRVINHLYDGLELAKKGDDQVPRTFF